MAIELTEGGGFIISGETDTRLYQVIALRTMLNTEIRTGMKFSNHGSPFAMLKRLGVIPQNTKTKAKGLEIVDAYLAEVKKTREKSIETMQAKKAWAEKKDQEKNDE